MYRKAWFTAMLLLAILGSMVPAALAQGPGNGFVTATEPTAEEALPAEEVATILGAGIEAVATQYVFSSSVLTYTEITTGTVHGTASNDDQSFNAIDLGFTFRYNNVDYTQVSIQSNGFIALGPTVASSYYPLSTGTTNNVISALGRDIQGNGTTSELRSLTEGTAGNHVFTVQWKHYKRYGSAYVGDDFNFQIKLYEATGRVEIVYGPFTVVYVASPPPGPQVGLRGNTNADFNNRKTDATHDWTNSLPGTTNADVMALDDVVYPPNGLTYRWNLATGVFLDPPSQTGSDCRGSDVVYTIDVINQTGTAQSFNLTYAGNAWPISGPATTGVIPHNGSETINVTVHVPWATSAGDSDTVTITAADPTNTYTDTATITTISALANDWQDYTNIPAGREVRAPSVVYYDGKLYVIGGYGYVGGTGAARPWVSIYDIATDTWTTGADMPAGRYWIDCEQLFDPNDNNRPKIYCAGGYLTSGTNTLYIYDIQNNSWSTGPTLPANRYNYASAKLDNKYYVIGGYTTSYSAEMLVYDPATNAWSTLAPMNTARRYFHAGVIGGKIYVAGGYNGSYLSSAEVYDPVQNTWTYVAPMPTPWLNGADGVKHDRFLVLAGGSPSSTSGASNGALVYDAQTDTWNWLPLLDHLIYGAEGDTDGNGDFWYATGRLYEGGAWLNSPYTTKLVQCGECSPVYGADFSVDPPIPRPTVPATFSGSVAGGSPPIAWEWDFGDGTYGSGQTVQHAYADSGIYTVVMTATNCDGASWVTATHDVQVMSGPMIVVEPEALESAQCPDCEVTQTLSICNEGDQTLVYTLTEVPGVLLKEQGIGIESLSGSFVVFDPSVGGDTCYSTGATQTFCFRAESFTNDWEYVYDLWQRFPSDWTVTNVYLQGTPFCTGGGTWGSFSWSFETVPYEVDIFHPRYQSSTDHCVAYYCFDVVAGTGVPNALVSWYWDGDGWGGPPHHPCSSDIYTPPSMASEPCDEWFNPHAFIPPCAVGPDIPWLSEYPTTGTVPPGQCQDVTVTFDSDSLTPGIYTGTLRIDNNDFFNPLVNVPVTLTVAGGPSDADFTWSPTEPYLYQDVTFTGSASGLLPIEYTWDFGDGTYGSGQVVTHAYSDWGTFTVTMSATQCGQTITAVHTLTVVPCWNVLQEHFEGTFPPDGWTVVNNGGNCVWRRNDQWAPARPNYAGGQGYCADADSDRCGSGTIMDTELWTFPLDLTGATTATLRFVAAYNDIATGGDYADVDVSADGGTTWVNLLHWDEDHSAYGPGELVNLDLTPYTAEDDLLVRFHYYTATYDWWWEVDQVQVLACLVPGAVPDIEVSPASLSQVLHPDETAEQALTIANLDIGALEWSADVGCGVPVGWLAMEPSAGTVPGHSSTEATVTFDSTGLGVGTYTADICIDSNDPDEPQVVVPVTLEVTGTPDIVVEPASLAAEQCPDTVTTQTLSVCNNGLAALEWSLSELTGTARLTGWKPAERPAVYRPEAAADVARSGEPTGAYLPASGATWSLPEDVLWDNGPLVTHPGGCGTTDASRLQTSLGMTTLGFGHQFIYGYRMSDDFEITDPAGWDIDTITFFAYQTGAPMSPSPITGVYLQIWDGPPWAGGSVVWGDLTTNRLLSSTFSGIQRDSETSPCANNRYIFANVAEVGTHLPPGHYWLDWTTDGSTSYSGPWAPPITILGQTTTGDAYQYTTAWAPALDGGTSTQQGMPFIIEGSVPQPVDVPWLFEEPTSGTVGPGQCQDVTVTFDSTGMAPGVYTAGLLIASNDPDTPEVTVPVTLTVLQPADILTVSYEIDDLTVSFDATAIGPDLEFAWDFGDGTGDTVEDPVHTYPACGFYTPTLVVSNACGSDSWSETLFVGTEIAGVDFLYSPSEPVAGQTVYFTASVAAGSLPISYEWDFGDGGTGSGDQVSHVFAAAGNYTVTVTATNACSAGVATHTILVRPALYWIYLPIVFKASLP